MVKTTNDHELLVRCSVNNRIRKLARHHMAKIRFNTRKAQGRALRSGNGSIYSAGELETKPRRPGLIPSLCRQKLGLSFWSEDHLHLVLALEQAVTTQVPRYCALRIKEQQ
jgi:hypothetical protein